MSRIVIFSCWYKSNYCSKVRRASVALSLWQMSRRWWCTHFNSHPVLTKIAASSHISLRLVLKKSTIRDIQNLSLWKLNKSKIFQTPKYNIIKKKSLDSSAWKQGRGSMTYVYFIFSLVNFMLTLVGHTGNKILWNCEIHELHSGPNANYLGDRFVNTCATELIKLFRGQSYYCHCS